MFLLISQAVEASARLQLELQTLLVTCVQPGTVIRTRGEQQGQVLGGTSAGIRTLSVIDVMLCTSHGGGNKMI